MLPTAAPIGRQDLVALVEDLLQRSISPIQLTGPSGVGRQTLARAAAAQRTARRAGPVVYVDASRAPSFAELQHVVRLHLHGVVGTAPTATDADLWIASQAQNGGLVAVIANLDALPLDERDEALRWLHGVLPARLIVTAVRPLLGVDGPVVPVPAFVAEDDAACRDAFQIFLDAIAAPALRARAAESSPDQVRACVRACGGLPALLASAGARTALMAPEEVLRILRASVSTAPDLPLLAALFGHTQADAVRTTLRLLSPGCAWTLRLCCAMGDAFEAASVVRITALFAQAVGTLSPPPSSRDSWSDAITHAGRSPHTALQHVEELLQLGLLERADESPSAPSAMRVPARVAAYLLGSPEDALVGWSEVAAAAQRATDQWLHERCREVVDESDSGQDPVAHARGLGVLRLAVQFLRRPDAPDAPADGHTGVLLPLRALIVVAWMARRTGVDLAIPSQLAQQTLQLVRVDALQSATPEQTELAARALCEVHMLGRQRGDASVRDACAARMQALVDTFPAPNDPRVCCAVSRCAYYLAAASLSQGNRAQAETLAQLAIDQARLAARQDMVARHSAVLAFLDMEGGKPARGLQRMMDAVHVLSTMGSRDEWMVAAMNLAAMAYNAGAVDMTHSVFRSIVESFPVGIDPYARATVAIGLARLAEVLQLPDATALHDEAVTLARSAQSHAVYAEALVRQGWHRILQRQANDAVGLEAFEEAVHVARRTNLPRMRAFAQHATAEALAELGRTDEAHSLAMAVLDEIPAERRAHRAEVLALCAATAARPDLAHTLLRQAWDIGVHLDAPLVATLLAIETLRLEVLDHQANAGAEAGLGDALGQRLVDLLRPVPPPFTMRGHARPPWQRSLTLVTAMRRLLRVVPEARLLLAESEAWWKAGTYVFLDRARAVQCPDGAWADFQNAPVLAHLLWALYEARQTPEGACSIETLQAVCWPGEKIRPDAAMNRLYQVISRVRRAGLRDLVQAHAGGYRLHPDAVVVAGVRP